MTRPPPRSTLFPSTPLSRSKDPDPPQPARADVERLRPELQRLEAALAELLSPADPFDDRDAIVEIRAGTGGGEAALFAADLFRLETRLCERPGREIGNPSLFPRQPRRAQVSLLC